MEASQPKPSGDAPASGSTLKKLALRGSAWQVLSFGGSQAIRLVSNLVLARLLFPEAFGLSALVAIFIQGLTMLSDVGIEPGVIQSARGDDEPFLNTAWTLQAIRGVGLWLIAWLLAWPFAQLYGEPELIWMIPVGSVSVLLSGLSSTSLYTLRRHMRLGTLTGIELGSQVIGTLTMVSWAYVQPSAWALVGSSVVTAVAKVAFSYAVPKRFPIRFVLEEEARSSIVHFGKWIFGASALFFLSKQGDRLLLGRYLGLTILGVYSIALFLSEALGMLISKITHEVLYPLFSRVFREDEARLGAVYYKARLAMDAVALTSLGVLAIIGSHVIDLLYDERYVAAGWMLEVMCVRVAMSCVLVPCETCLFSMGHTRYGFFQNLARTAWIAVAIPVGFHLRGVEGVVWATVLSELPVAMVLWPAFARLGMMRWSREVLAIGFFATGLLVGTGLDMILPSFR